MAANQARKPGHPKKFEWIGSMKKTLGNRIKANAGLLLLALPSVIFIFIFNYLPLYGLILPFKNLNYELGFFKSPWAGLNNFRFLFNSNDILIATRNTLLYNFAFIFIGTFCSVVTALMLLSFPKVYKGISDSIILSVFSIPGHRFIYMYRPVRRRLRHIEQNLCHDG